MAATFNDIRAACQSAQSRIMRLQQATNTQVGLTSTIRETWFDELRSIAHGFITAQQVSARMEQAMTTERAQLQGALSAALNERDVARAERDAALQEVNFLRTRLSENMSNTSPKVVNGENPKNGLSESLSEKSSWLLENCQDEDGIGSPQITTGDLLQHLPTKVEDMPLTPEKYPKLSTLTSMVHSHRATTPDGNLPSKNQNYHRTDVYNTTSSSQKSHHNVAVTDFNHGQNNGSVNGNTNGAVSKFHGGGYRTPYSSTGPFPPPSSQNRSGHDYRSSTSGSGSVGMHSYSQSRSSQAISQHWNGQTGQASQNVPACQAGHGGGMKALPAPAPMREQNSAMQLALVRPPSLTFQGYAPGVPPPDREDQGRVREIFQFFNTVTEWVGKYCNAPNRKIIEGIERLFPRLWDYACSATYPSEPSNAASHSRFMIGNDEARRFFLSRLLIQYVVQQMWNPQSWEGLDDNLTEALRSVRSRIDTRNGYDAILSPDERQMLVEKRSQAIYNFMRRPDWHKVRSQKMSVALTRFKDIVGPLMNRDDTNRQAALNELASLSENALRLSAILNTSKLSFQFIFNECGIKFSEQSHRPINSLLSPLELQARHWRIMCVVTPGITYRNDAGTMVDPRFLAKANVLVMQ